MNKNKPMILKAALFLGLFCIVSPEALAQTSWALNQEGSMVNIQGECNEKQTKIELFKNGESKDSLKTIIADCEDGKFFLSKDFSESEIPTGNYIVAVGGEKSQNLVSIVKKGGIKSKNFLDNEVENKTQEKESAELRFLDAFAVFQQSILDMRTWLAETKYPSWAKSGIDGALDGIDKLVGKISDMLFSADSQQSETAQAETANDSTATAQDYNDIFPATENSEAINNENQASNSEVINN